MNFAGRFSIGFFISNSNHSFEKNKIMSSFIDFGLAFKNKIIELKEGDTQLTLKELALVRLVKKKFFQDLEGLYELAGM